ncbi:hypothetical protein ACOMHN_023871 [Nucella lapillus]
METPTAHRGLYIGVTVANLIVLLTVYFFNAAQPSIIPGIFKNTVGNQSDKYYLQITPAGWTFSIWGVIYTWQALWVIYSLVLLCRRSRSVKGSVTASPAYLSPVLLPPAMFVLYMCGNACNIAWLFLFDRGVIEAAFVSLLGIEVFLIIALAVSYRALDAALAGLVEQRRTLDIWLVRAFVHNGLGIYATWTSIATLLNLAMVVRYRSDPVIGDQTAGTVALAVLSVEILIFFATDLLLLDRYTRYTFTPYFVVVIALIGSIAKNWDSDEVNSIFTAVLMGVGAGGLVVKVVMSVYRHFRRSPYPVTLSPTIGDYKGGQLA